MHCSSEISLAAPDAPVLINPSSFTSLPELYRDDADTTLVFLSINGSYMSEVHDPWFRATVPTNMTAIIYGNDSTGDYVLHSADKPVNIVACAEQHQFRNPANGATSALRGQELFVTEPTNLTFNDEQNAIFNRSFWIGCNTLLTVITTALDSNLLADESRWYDNDPGLPDNQWQLEFNHWFGIGLLTIQLWSQQYVNGIVRPDLNRYVTPATTSFQKEMCVNQITRRADYRSFSVLGLTIVLILGILFTILNYIVEPIVHWTQSRTSDGRYRNAEWQANDFLQLQRMAYEHNDMGTWRGHDNVVPLTNSDDKFIIPDSTRWNEAPPDTSDNTGKFLRFLSHGSRNATNDSRFNAANTNTGAKGKTVVSEVTAEEISDSEKKV